MNWAPLVSAAPAVQIHALAAMTAFVLGIWQLAAMKGTARHSIVGYVWVLSMLIVAASSFRIRGINHWLGFSVIHLLSIQVLVTAPLAILAARNGNIRRHRLAMIGMFVGALIVAGAFTLMPGRVMHQVMFGGTHAAR